jgi:hypothetical protein
LHQNGTRPDCGWWQAEAVRDGRQPASDPDAGDVEEIRQGLRLYRRRDEPLTTGSRTTAKNRYLKRLVDGWWESGYELDEP